MFAPAPRKNTPGTFLCDVSGATPELVRKQADRTPNGVKGRIGKDLASGIRAM
jgi:hypothetical protein